MHLATWMPFARAVQLLERLLGVPVSEPTVRRQTEAAGAQVEAVQTAQAYTSEPEESWEPGAARQVMRADGADVPLLKGEWAEVRTVAMGEGQEESSTAEEPEVHGGRLSYFSRLTDAATFADLAEVELRRRRVRQAKAVCAVTDGADWLQSFLDLQSPEALRILDFPHAAEHISLLLQAVQQAGVNVPADLLGRILHHLKHRGPLALLRLLERLPPQAAERDAVREQASYLVFARRLDAVPCLSAGGMAHWIGYERKCHQRGGPSAPQRRWDALATSPRQSLARLTQRGVQRSLGGRRA